ncbi:hypothetical protein DCC81_08400 [Chitinophaga parva]|uniref:Uncharacterized protein n=1 Tax=Chitinophaga parva TaxID=2169414 RepID=A0A2T7BP47_9BACT|nr:hypothetical protein [Chitinophaga parva]PUZ29455.1 hypothetical protein DCC81_08400 [Chitinophaga parva]
MHQSTLLKWRQYVSVLCSVILLAVFFSVQCIRNFDVGNTIYLPITSVQASHHTQELSSPKHAPTTRIKIRLNKRFQSTSIGFASKWPEPPVITYLELVRQYYFYDSNLLSTIRLHESLRGPPALSC